jgi:thiol-disulfide isomerase/thioredoxin
MDNDTSYLAAREIILEQLKNSELKNSLKYKEVEVVYPGTLDHEIKINGRVSKDKQMAMEEFREVLFDMLADKMGNEYATAFIEDNFDVEVGLSEGDKFPGLEAFDTTGTKVNITSKSGEVLMIDYWATWCGYCQDPMQENVDLMTKNSNLKDKNISIVGVSCDEDNAKWRNHLNERKWNTIPQYVKVGLLKHVGIKGIPCVAIIDKNGIVAYFGHPGSINLEESLINLTEGKPVVRIGDVVDGSNAFWKDLDNQSKIDIVAESNFALKDAGIINATFVVNSKFLLDPETYQVNLVKTTPVFYGEVTQFEYETTQIVSTTLQDKYNLNGFVFNLKVMQIGADEDF